MHKNGWDEEVQDIIVCKIDISIHTLMSQLAPPGKAIRIKHARGERWQDDAEK